MWHFLTESREQKHMGKVIVFCVGKLETFPFFSVILFYCIFKICGLTIWSDVYSVAVG
jgi:hypothetical protein